jgi:ATP-dependent exoDNAse (exonuclease V) alpha subunit
LYCIPGRKIAYSSVDQVCEQQHQLNVCTEYLNQVENGSLLPHQLDLKIGVPIMVLRNMSASAGLFNGTRLIVRSLGTNIIEAVIATGPRAGDIAYIPKIKFTYSSADGKYPYDFKRTQFPVRLAFAMTINKAQGQTLDSIGLYLPCHVFGHGQIT